MDIWAIAQAEYLFASVCRLPPRQGSHANNFGSIALIAKALTVTNPLSEITATAYHADGQVLAVTNAENETVNDTYGEFGRMTAVTNGTINSTEYDAAGGLTKTDQVTSGVTTYTYSNGDELLTSQDASGITTYTYDANGNRETITDPSFTVTHNAWDPENRLIEVSEGLDVTE